MKMPSRLIIFVWLGLLLLGTACSLPAQTPIVPTATTAATLESTSTTAPTEITISETPTAFIPITGMDVVSLQCQFCVNEEAHAVLTMSTQAFFNVADPNTGVTCLSAQEVNGRRILLCRGAQQVSFHLNVCVGEDNCLQFPVTLQPCPLDGTGTPTTLTPFGTMLLTPIPASSTPGPRNTPVPATVPATETPVSQPTDVTAGPTTPPSPEPLRSPEPSSTAESNRTGTVSETPSD